MIVSRIRSRPRSAALVGLAVLSLAGCLAAAGGIASMASAEPAQELRVGGEFGLHVHGSGDSTHVRWLTAVPAAGFLEVRVDGEVRHRFATPARASHHAAFPTPAGAFQLTYGRDGPDEEDRHDTRIHPGRGATAAPARVTGVDSLYVIGDIHGEYDNMVAVLRNAGLVDEALRWSGGRRHLVALGDMMSRGMDVAAVLWFLYRLEGEAEAAGGRVHVMLGNHEMMVMLRDLRYVHQKESWIAESHGFGYDRLYDPRHSVLGRWLATKPALLQVDDVLLAHGGVSEAYSAYTPESFRDTLQTFISEDLFYHWADPDFVAPIDEAGLIRRDDLLWDSLGVFWYRGYAQSAERGGELQRVLTRFGASLHVVAHTPVQGMREGYDGRLILTNTLPFADEVLLLVRTDAGWERSRIGRDGPPRPLIRGHLDGGGAAQGGGALHHRH